MAAVSGIWNHAMAATPLTTTKAMSSASDSSTSADGDASTISANDFLTLLVTEMKNQDPTANTDPNEYINQLVQVNSLEQLIDINQNLSTALGDSSTGTTTSPTGKVVSSPGSLNGTSAAAVRANQPAQTTGSTGAGSAESNATTAFHNVGAQTISGNLSVPGAAPAAHRVAQALSGRN